MFDLTLTLPAPGLPTLLFATLLAVCVLATIHILLTRKEASSAVAWTGLVWLSPGLGALLYVTLGINRVRRKAVRLLGSAPKLPPAPPIPSAEELPQAYRHLPVLARAVGAITGEPLLGGNRIEPLRNGDEIYPAMLAAIDAARTSLGFLTYILDDDPWGRRFVASLVAAHERGVAVRVLIDGIGARRSWGPVRDLRAAGVPTEVFLWSWKPWKMALINLRNHRKLLVADGVHAYTGGANVGADFVHDPSLGGTGTARDLHFSVRGPVVRRLQAQFLLDWAFASGGEVLGGDDWYPDLPPAGTTFARVIPDGPDEDLDKAAMTMLQAVNLAQERVLILTPYFLPPAEIHAALRAAVQRGVEVRIVLPETNEPQWMNRATIADCEELVGAGVHIGFQPGCFEHTKLMVVDDAWLLLGSTNWDLRSLRLNFELNVECYDRGVVADTLYKIAEDLPRVRWLTPTDMERRSPIRKLADAAIRLFKPWL